MLVRAEDAEPLLRMFTHDLGLPVSWELQRSNGLNFGWVNVGNTHLEFWAQTGHAGLPADALPCVAGLALEPALPIEHTVAQARRRGLACKEPHAWRTHNAQGELVTNFSNAVVLDLSAPPAVETFFCEWDARCCIYPRGEERTTAQRKSRDRAAFTACAGGVLGLTGLRRVEWEARDPRAWRDRWAALTAGGAQVAPGIALACQAGEVERIASLTFGVRDLAGAREALARRGWLAQDASGTCLALPGASRLILRLEEDRG